MRKLFTLLVAVFAALFSAGQLAAQSPASVTLIKAGRLLDPKAGNMLSPAAVLIQGDRIIKVCAPVQMQKDGRALSVC